MSPELPYSPLVLPLPVTKTKHTINILIFNVHLSWNPSMYLIFDFFISAFVSSKNVSVIRAILVLIIPCAMGAFKNYFSTQNALFQMKSVSELML